MITPTDRAFFPSGNPFVSLMLSLMTFGAGFLMRPLGAIVLGAYTDRHGRQQTDRGVSGHARDGATAGHKGFYVSYDGAMVVFLTHVRFLSPEPLVVTQPSLLGSRSRHCYAII